MFENLFTKTQMWPGSIKFPLVRYTVIAIFVTFCVLLPVKTLWNFQRDSIENGIVNTFGCLMAVAFMIRLTTSEDKFKEVFDFIRNDFKTNPSDTEKDILEDIGKEIRNVMNYVIFIFPLAIISKLSSPFMEYGFNIFMIKDSNTTVALRIPPPMALPTMQFLYFNEFIVYSLEIGIRTLMLCYLMTVAMLFALSSLYVGGQLRLLASELENLSIDDEKEFLGYIKRHEELIR